MLILVNKPDISKIKIIMFGIALTSVKVMTSKKKKREFSKDFLIIKRPDFDL